MLGPTIQIKKNALLHGSEKSMDLDKFLLLKKVADLGKQAQIGRDLNLTHVSEAFVQHVHTAYGPAGLFQLMVLAMAHERSEFRHFIDAIQGTLILEGLGTDDGRVALACDNALLRQSTRLDPFQFNVMQPSLARKLYRAGRKDGSLVYGLGGARILVSHPYQGRNEEIYNLYSN